MSSLAVRSSDAGMVISFCRCLNREPPLLLPPVGETPPQRQTFCATSEAEAALPRSQSQRWQSSAPLPLPWVSLATLVEQLSLQDLPVLWHRHFHLPS